MDRAGKAGQEGLRSCSTEVCLLSGARFPWSSHPCLSERKIFAFPCLSSCPFSHLSGQGIAVVFCQEEAESDLDWVAVGKAFLGHGGSV